MQIVLFGEAAALPEFQTPFCASQEAWRHAQQIEWHICSAGGMIWVSWIGSERAFHGRGLSDSDTGTACAFPQEDTASLLLIVPIALKNESYSHLLS